MAPRELKTTLANDSSHRFFIFHGGGGGEEVNDHTTPNKQTKNSNHTHQNHDTTSSQRKQPRIILFRLGPLRFGVHGIAGIFGLIFVSWALIVTSSYNTTSLLSTVSTTTTTTTPMYLSILIIITTMTSSIGSYDLLHQVPNTSHISSWIFPPHREAFKRTIAITGYLNLRLVHLWLSSSTKTLEFLTMMLSVVEGDDNLNIVSCLLLPKESLLFPFILFVYTIYHFFPRQLDYMNGNIWVFVVPMFLGFSMDTIHQFPKITNGSGIQIVQEEGMKELFQNIDWEEVHNWNTAIINETYLLLTLLCTLQIAFMFTVAFRGKMSIKACYWIAAIEVGLLCVRLLM